jgi:hypothetical protein
LRDNEKKVAPPRHHQKKAATITARPIGLISVSHVLLYRKNEKKLLIDSRHKNIHNFHTKNDTFG